MSIERLTLNTKHHSTSDPIASIVANWHDRNHDGPFRTCQEQPCDAVREKDGAARF